MITALFVDYGNTIDAGDYGDPELNTELIATLKEFRENGGMVVLTTDTSAVNAFKYVQILADAGHTDLFDAVLSHETFGKAKKEEGYWQNVLSAFNLQAKDIVVIDDNVEILANADNAGICNICSLPRHAIIGELTAVRNKMKVA